MVDTVKALAEPMRWRIVQLLADEELCVCHLVEELDVPQPLGQPPPQGAARRRAGRVRTVPVLDLLPAPRRSLRRRGRATWPRIAERAPAAAASVAGRAAESRTRPWPARLTAEAVGTGLLVAIVVGSGIFAARLSPDDVGLQLLENSTATAGGLVALILAFGSVSGAHFNPIVSLADRIFGGLTTRELLAYVPAQIAGACVGAIVANLMFDLDAVDALHPCPRHQRALARRGRRHLRAADGDPRRRPLRQGRHRAVRGRPATSPPPTGSRPRPASPTPPSPSAARSATPSPASNRRRRPAFIAAQVAGGLLAVALARFLFPDLPALDLVVPHDHTEAA